MARSRWCAEPPLRLRRRPRPAPRGAGAGAVFILRVLRLYDPGASLAGHAVVTPPPGSRNHRLPGPAGASGERPVVDDLEAGAPLRR